MQKCPKCPEGTVILAGLQAQRIAPYKEYLKDKEAVIFDSILDHSNSYIKYDCGTGTFRLKKCATYLINWTVSVEGSERVPFIRFALKINDKIYGPSAMPITVGQLTGSNLITTTWTPTTLQLINDTEDMVRLAPITPIANIVISTNIG